MLRNLSETVILGSNTIFLNVPEKEYFYSYYTVSKEAAKEIAKGYFIATGKKGTPFVREISVDPTVHNVEITVEVD